MVVNLSENFKRKLIKIEYNCLLSWEEILNLYKELEPLKRKARVVVSMDKNNDYIIFLETNAYKFEVKAHIFSIVISLLSNKILSYEKEEKKKKESKRLLVNDLIFKRKRRI